ncbi:MAG: Nif3-like dinuclear metal center hexameric protein [Elusimicrobiota bacterium]
MKRDKLITFLNNYLKANEIKDSSQNGLQVEGKDEIKKILFGVSYSSKLVEKAIQEKAEMIILHHGILWNKPIRICGIFKKRVEPLIKNEINLAAYHLPLDIHPKIGNNISILKIFNIKHFENFGDYNGIKIGFIGKLPKKISLEEIANKIKKEINKNAIFINYGKKLIEKIAVVSGGGTNFFEEAVIKGADIFITGEGDEKAYELAREYRSNFVSAGHYRTEVFGIKELSKIISKKFKIKTLFIETNNPF